MPNIYTPLFDQDRHSPDGFHALRALIGRQAGAERLGMSLWELPAGQAAYPYHFHLNDEELIVVLDGGLSLRTPDGWRDLEPGAVVSFPVGERGAHQLMNRSEDTVRFLAFSSAGQPDTCVYPDSRKVGMSERRPGGFTMRIVYDQGDTDVEYWRGERPPSRP